MKEIDKYAKLHKRQSDISVDLEFKDEVLINRATKWVTVFFILLFSYMLINMMIELNYLHSIRGYFIENTGYSFLKGIGVDETTNRLKEWLPLLEQNDPMTLNAIERFKSMISVNFYVWSLGTPTMLFLYSVLENYKLKKFGDTLPIEAGLLKLIGTALTVLVLLRSLIVLAQNHLSDPIPWFKDVNFFETQEIFQQATILARIEPFSFINIFYALIVVALLILCIRTFCSKELTVRATKKTKSELNKELSQVKKEMDEIWRMIVSDSSALMRVIDRDQSQYSRELNNQIDRLINDKLEEISLADRRKILLTFNINDVKNKEIKNQHIIND